MRVDLSCLILASGSKINFNGGNELIDVVHKVLTQGADSDMYTHNKFTMGNILHIVDFICTRLVLTLFTPKDQNNVNIT